MSTDIYVRVSWVFEFSTESMCFRSLPSLNHSSPRWTRWITCYEFVQVDYTLLFCMSHSSRHHEEVVVACKVKQCITKVEHILFIITKYLKKKHSSRTIIFVMHTNQHNEILYHIVILRCFINKSQSRNYTVIKKTYICICKMPSFLIFRDTFKKKSKNVFFNIYIQPNKYKSTYLTN